MEKTNNVIINNFEVPIEGEKNLLELIRKANIEIPTFCYHSELSVYGACRLCMVEIEGRGLQASCSIKPEPGMKVKTNTDEIREIRKTIIELLLANHDYNCPTCSKSNDCKLQALSKKNGITDLRFDSTVEVKPIDFSSPSIIRDPNRCILCGDCVRMCSEIQGVGAIDFANRGSEAAVLPSFGKDLAKGECVNCGQCVRVCPTGALIINPQIDKAWKAINDKEQTVVVQIAPAVRVALGEKFGITSGNSVTGQIVAALKRMGVDKVFDTSFTADLTIIEETNEFLKRAEKGALPLFTSCCPSWVKYAEQYHNDLLDNVSTCKSPQQMFGAVAKNILAEKMKIDPKNMTLISIMPCTAKKFEAQRPEFEKDGVKEVDIVLTTQELANMIDEMGLDFANLSPESLDMPLGFKTGAGIIFGNSGGVSEAVLRYAHEVITGEITEEYEFKSVRGDEGIRKAKLELNGKEYSFAVVHGLANAEKLIEDIQNGEKIDFIEVMACPGGCVGGAGQPVPKNENTRTIRKEGLYNTDKTLQLHKSQENPYIKDLYEKHLGSPNSEKAHELLHTKYKNRARTLSNDISLSDGEGKIKVGVCIGTNCNTKGSQKILKELTDYLAENNMLNNVEVKATFCFENCKEAPNVKVNNTLIGNATTKKVIDLIKEDLEKHA